MQYSHKIKKLFLYAGVDKEEYNRLLPSIREENRLLLKVFSQLAVVMFFALFIASVISTGFASINSPTYLVFGLIMLGVLMCTTLVLPKYPAYVMAFVYIFETMLYVFGIHISMLHAEKPAVSAVAFLLVSPLLFYDRPIRLSMQIAIVVAVFCIMVLYFKEPEVSQTDIWNMVTFGILAVATTVFIMSIKIRALYQSSQIEYLSQTDLLTGIKNRNHYENRLEEYPKMVTSNLICVYADVNGLHEMNNKEGHQAGDRMLREVAGILQEKFGPDHTYRIGGDEFVVFRIDGKPENISSEIEEIKEKLDKQGYHVAFGSSVYQVSEGKLEMYELVKSAENKMFAAKKEFYSESENDRENR